MNYEKKVIHQLDEIIKEIKGINNEIKKVDKDLKDYWETKHDEQTEAEIDSIIEEKIEKEGGVEYE